MSADKPSEQAIHVAKVLLHLNANRPLTVENLALVIDEQRRNARAEAFEEAAGYMRRRFLEQPAAEFERLAAKERTQ